MHRPTVDIDQTTSPGSAGRAALCALLLSAGVAAQAQTTDCAGLPAKAPTGVALLTEAVAGDRLRPPGVTTGDLLAAHCKVTGRMADRIGADGKPYYIGFEMRLPTQWNGRFLYQGGGGNDGIVRPAIGPQASTGYALNRGFAVVTTDAGHQGPSGVFGFDPIARTDNAYNAHDKVAVTAKQLVRGYYAKPADKAYFVGCSGGGRQGMMFTQRFPSYFDGVLAMAPAMRVSKGATIGAAWDSQVLQAIAPSTPDGKRILSQALENSDLQLLGKGILDACDAQDGIADGIVSNPAACRFDPAVLQCKSAKDASCLSTPQVDAVKKIFGGASNSAGQKLYFSWPFDAGVGHPQNDWRAWKLGTSTTAEPNSRHVALMQDALRHYFITPPDPKLDIFAFDFDKDPARMDAHSWIFDTADDVQLSAFKARGGKLLFAHGLADPIFSPDEMVDYYRRLSAVHGAQTPDFSRLFLIPGMGHCSGGAATDRWDGLGALVDWVEKGTAPERIVATGTTVFPGRSRPLCSYPRYAHYNGSGDPEQAANFSCR